MSMSRLRAALIASALLLFINHSSGWGLTGHRVIAKIASNNISHKTKEKIAELIDNEDLVMVSNWMDEIRSDSSYHGFNDWHWVSIPDGKVYAESEKNLKGDVIWAIEYCKTVLISDTSVVIKVQYLKFLVHLIGDLHQPLHIGNGSDAGGNAVKVKWFGSSSNLHSIWDSKMIDSKKWSYSELAENLQKEFRSTEQIFAGDIESWAVESLRFRDQIYDFNGKTSLGYEYMYKNWPLVKSQLWKAGLRLAKVLDEIYCEC